MILLITRWLDDFCTSYLAKSTRDYEPLSSNFVLRFFKHLHMKLKIYLYHFTRIAFGAFLVVYSTYNVIRYSGYLDRLDGYFVSVSLFDNKVLEALAPLVPFEEFVIGFFLVLGMFTKHVLKISVVLFAFFTLFLWDAGRESCAFIHLLCCLVSLVLLKKDNYDLRSKDYTEDFYRLT